MEIRPIKSEADYQAALSEIDTLFDAEPGTPQADRLEVLTTLVEAYEERHHSIPAPDPVEAVRYFMESRGLSRKDLEPYLGSRARVSEILGRKRPLTLRMIQRLHYELGIPADVLLMPYRVGGTQKPKRLLPDKRIRQTRAARSSLARTAEARR